MADNNILKSDHIISDEVKRLGLTAHVNHKLTKDEQYLQVEFQPKIRVRRRSSELKDTFNTAKRTNLCENEGLHLVDTRISSTSETQSVDDLDKLSDVCLKRQSRDHDTDNTLRKSVDDLERHFPRLSFHHENEVIKRTNSAEGLKKLKAKLLLNKELKSLISNEESLRMSDSEDDESIKEVDSKEGKFITSGDSSKINYRFHTENQDLVEIHSNAEVTINEKSPGEVTDTNVPFQHCDEINSHEHNASIREKLSHIGKESVHWLKTGKVSPTKREENWISPVSF